MPMMVELLLHFRFDFYKKYKIHTQNLKNVIKYKARVLRSIKEKMSMSQEKVDRYKEEKANRKQIMKKEKITKLMHQCVLGVVSLTIIGWLGFSAYGSYMDKQPRQKAVVDYSYIQEFLTGQVLE